MYIKSKSIIIVLLATILSIVIGFTTTKYFTPTNIIVEITKDGFDPRSVTIQKGDSVTWINKFDRPAWPASNSHPNHTEYLTDKKGCIESSLDSCRGLSRNQSFTFNFNRIGVWGMHDHLYPGFTMNVEVLPKILFFPNLGKKSEQEENEKFKGIPAEKDFKDLNYIEKQAAIEKLNNKDPKLAWSYLKKAAIENGEVVVDVHEFAHSIGNKIFKRYGFDGITFCSSDFAYGCFHGVTEQMLTDKGVNHLKEIEKKCLELYPHDGGALIDDPGCIHGIGHGIFTWNNHDLTMSLKDCDRLMSAYRSFCGDGVLMELSSSVSDVLENHDPWKFCVDLDSGYQSQCARYITEFLLQNNSFDAQKFADICMRGPDEQLRESCMSHVGYQVAYLHNQDEKAIIKECKSMTDEMASTYCFMSAARELAFQKYPNWAKISASLCRRVPAGFASECNDVK